MSKRKTKAELLQDNYNLSVRVEELEDAAQELGGDVVSLEHRKDELAQELKHRDKKELRLREIIESRLAVIGPLVNVVSTEYMPQDMKRRSDDG